SHGMKYTVIVDCNDEPVNRPAQIEYAVNAVNENDTLHMKIEKLRELADTAVSGMDMMNDPDPTDKTPYDPESVRNRCIDETPYDPNPEETAAELLKLYESDDSGLKPLFDLCRITDCVQFVSFQNPEIPKTAAGMEYRQNVANY